MSGAETVVVEEPASGEQGEKVLILSQRYSAGTVVTFKIADGLYEVRVLAVSKARLGKWRHVVEGANRKAN